MCIQAFLLATMSFQSKVRLAMADNKTVIILSLPHDEKWRSGFHKIIYPKMTTNTKFKDRQRAQTFHVSKWPRVRVLHCGSLRFTAIQTIKQLTFQNSLSPTKTKKWLNFINFWFLIWSHSLTNTGNEAINQVQLLLYLVSTQIQIKMVKVLNFSHFTHFAVKKYLTKKTDYVLKNISPPRK